MACKGRSRAPSFDEDKTVKTFITSLQGGPYCQLLISFLAISTYSDME